MHLCRSTGWVDVVLVRLSCTTASRHGMVVHHRYERARPANRGQSLQMIVAAVRTISREPSSLSIIEAHLVVRKNVHQHVHTLLHKRKSE